MSPDEFLPLKPQVLLILHVLSESARHGYTLIEELERRSEGTVKLNPGTLYRLLHRMLEDELIEEAEERPAPDLDDARRRYYRITRLGVAVLRAELDRLSRLVATAGRAARRPRRA